MIALTRSDRRVEMAVVGDAERDAVRAAGRDHAIAFGGVHRHRLLAEHVLAGFGRGNRLFRMEVAPAWRRRRVDLRIGDEIPPARIPSPGADLARERLRQIGARAADGHEIAAGASRAPAPRACGRCRRRR